jgi:hypothetical protein
MSGSLVMTGAEALGKRLAGRALLAPLGPLGWGIGAALLLYDAYELYNVYNESHKETEDKPAEECAEGCDSKPKKIDKKPPFKGEPNSTVQGPDNSRTYGDDGYPLTDRDAGHADETGIGAGDHSHDWGRPADGSMPTAKDRGPSRLPTPTDPPAPWRNTPSS